MLSLFLSFQDCTSSSHSLAHSFVNGHWLEGWERDVLLLIFLFSCWGNRLVLSSFLFSFSQSHSQTLVLSVCQTDGLIVGLWREVRAKVNTESSSMLFFFYVFCAHWIRHSTSEEFFFGSSWLKSAQERESESAPVLVAVAAAAETAAIMAISC